MKYALLLLLLLPIACDSLMTFEMSGSSGGLEEAVYDFCQRKPAHEICLIDWGQP